MKCAICEKEFDIQKSHGGHNRIICYDCLPFGLSRLERNRRRKELVTLKINEYKISKGCSICGYNKCGQALEFHHIDNNKEFSIANKVKDSTNLTEVMNEIDKCVLLCANCHREVHYKI